MCALAAWVGETRSINAVRTMISLNDEARKSILGTVDALRQWSNEIGAVNDRCLRLLKACKLEAEVIDRVADA